jgi:hypothetical protein
VKDGFQKANVAEGEANDSKQEVVVEEAAPMRDLSVGVIDDHRAETHLWSPRLPFLVELASAFPLLSAVSSLVSEWASAFAHVLSEVSPLVSEWPSAFAHVFSAVSPLVSEEVSAAFAEGSAVEFAHDARLLSQPLYLSALESALAFRLPYEGKRLPRRATRERLL